jgi:DHA1 family bicyclomycin/chloramphenicol resistance-like MFS transporter
MSNATPVAPTAIPSTPKTVAQDKPPLHLLLALSALMSLGSLSTDMYLPSLPTLGEAFGVNVATVQLTLTTFLAGFCSGQLIWGPIGDHYGRRVPAAVGLALFAVGSAGCALSGSVGEMIAWRLFQAFGAAAGPVLARAMVRDLYARDQAARMLSVLILVMAVAPLLGPILGSFVLVHRDWQAIFWVQAALGLAGLAGLATIRETLQAENRTPLRLADVLISYNGLLRQPRLLGYALSSGFYYGAMYAYLAGTPFAYINLYHVSPQIYGWLFGLNICGMMATNALNSRLVTSVGADRVLQYGIFITALGGLALAIDARFGFGGLAGLVAPIFVMVSMNGAVVANSIAGALSAFPRKAGAASALVGAVQLGMGMVTTAMTGWFADGSAFPYAAIIGLTGVCAVVANVWLVPAQRGG